MSANRRTNFILIIIFLLVIAVFAFTYNTSVTTALTNVAVSDKDFLQTQNNKIINELTTSESINDWNSIVNNYQDIVVYIEDSANNIIAQTNHRAEASGLDVKVRSAFEYKGKAYLMTTSVYLLRDYQNEMLKFVLIEIFILLSVIAFLVFIVYTIMLRPYRRFYLSIEEYEKTGVFRETKFKGYIGLVYKRFGELTKNLERQQNNQRRIIASISHDIKTPLTSIMGYAERLKKDNISPERRERYLNTVYDKSLQIRGLVDEFDEYLSYNMQQSVKTELVGTDQLRDLIENEYADELESMGVDFEVTCHGDRCAVLIDRPKMKRVFGNMVGNSVKHFNDGEKKIRIDIESKKKKVVIHFGDNGNGVEKENLEVIFEPLYTSDKGRRVAGLGLAICREIVESHGGKIYAVKSVLGGLEVCIELERVNAD